MELSSALDERDVKCDDYGGVLVFTGSMVWWIDGMGWNGIGFEVWCMYPWCCASGSVVCGLPFPDEVIVPLGTWG